MIKLLFLFLFASFAASRFLSAAFAAEPFLKPNDVIALVGGEDMVAAAEYGYLELLLTRALPDHRLKFRCLAWEGDTVFEQRRDLNFPTWEEQLEKIGATVVICQFGQMESLAGKEKLPEFIAAYEKLIGRFSGGGKRRIAVLSQPGGLPEISPGLQPGVTRARRERPEGAREGPAAPAGADPPFTREPRVSPGANFPQPSGLEAALRIQVAAGETRDGIHASPSRHLANAFELSVALVSFRANLAAAVKEPEGEADFPRMPSANQSGALDSPQHERLRQLIIAKNRLWDRYWRVQNWAFLAGDRTTQASSRDHLDPSKRWFPAEREAFIPLIEKKEQEIWALAAKQR